MLELGALQEVLLMSTRVHVFVYMLYIINGSAEFADGRQEGETWKEERRWQLQHRAIRNITFIINETNYIQLL